jgi:hypothetical protein
MAEEQLHALAHLLRGLVGEGDGQQLARARATGLHQPRDAVRQDARLARAGAGEDQQRAVTVRDGLALRRVEALQQGLDALIGRGFGHDG